MILFSAFAASSCWWNTACRISCWSSQSRYLFHLTFWLIRLRIWLIGFNQNATVPLNQFCSSVLAASLGIPALGVPGTMGAIVAAAALANQQQQQQQTQVPQQQQQQQPNHPQISQGQSQLGLSGQSFNNQTTASLAQQQQQSQQQVMTSSALNNTTSALGSLGALGNLGASQNGNPAFWIIVAIETVLCAMSHRHSICRVPQPHYVPCHTIASFFHMYSSYQVFRILPCKTQGYKAME